MKVPTPPNPPSGLQWGRSLEVFLVFLQLGLTSFGGPVAHLGYFRTELVERRQWLDDKSYSDLVALCQFLPGPASSQVGMALGQLRAGWLGSVMAWIGFTLPSALALIVLAYGIAQSSNLAASGAVHGLKVVAVAVVAQAVWGMAKSLCPDRTRAALAMGAALLTLALPGWLGQVGAIVACALIGGWRIRLPHQAPLAHTGHGVSRRAGAVALLVFFVLLMGLPLWVVATGSPLWALVEGFYRSGALVFGGGHVVLPLLQSTVVPSGAVSPSAFLAGYGAAQAMPGPLFSFAAYLGAVMSGSLPGWLGGLVMLLAIFLPGWLLVIGALPFWDALRQREAVRNAMAGVNAAVVGILLSALYDPVWTHAIEGPLDVGLALLALLALMAWRVPPWAVVGACALAGWLLG